MAAVDHTVAAADHTGVATAEVVAAATVEAVVAVDMAPTRTAVVEEWVEVVALVLEDLGAL